MEFPICANMLLYELPRMERPARFFCPICPYVRQIENKVKIKRGRSIPFSPKTTTRVSTPLQRLPAPECNHKEAYFSQVQTRSADEPMTLFYNCKKCDHTWRED